MAGKETLATIERNKSHLRLIVDVPTEQRPAVDQALAYREKEVDEALTAGRYKTFDTMEEMIAFSTGSLSSYRNR